MFFHNVFFVITMSAEDQLSLLIKKEIKINKM
jgi:hypothetical protein